MNFFIEFFEEVVRFLVILEELYHAWTMSPHLHVIMMGRGIIAIIVIMMIVVMWAGLKICLRGGVENEER